MKTEKQYNYKRLAVWLITCASPSAWHLQRARGSTSIGNTEMMEPTRATRAQFKPIINELWLAYESVRTRTPQKERTLAYEQSKLDVRTNYGIYSIWMSSLGSKFKLVG